MFLIKYIIDIKESKSSFLYKNFYPENMLNKILKINN